MPNPITRASAGRTLLAGALAVGLLAPAGAAFAATSAKPLPAGVTRAGGDTRIDTALAVSTRLFPGGSAPAAVLATSSIYPDSIGGARLASAVGGPLLLTGPGALAAPVGTELKRVVAAGGTIYLLGGESALTAAVATQVAALGNGYTVTRVGGADRYETATKTADEVTRLAGDTGPIYLATGVNFPDGLAVAALAAHTGGVVVLSNGDFMPASTTSYLAAHDTANTRVVPVGGPAAVARPAPTRAIYGADRYETAAKIAAKFTSGDGGAPVTTVAIAVGSTWPDALVGAAAVGQLNGPLLLSSGLDLGATDTAAVQQLVSRNPTLHSGLIVGGTAAVPVQAETDLAALVK